RQAAGSGAGASIGRGGAAAVADQLDLPCRALRIDIALAGARPAAHESRLARAARAASARLRVRCGAKVDPDLPAVEALPRRTPDGREGERAGQFPIPRSRWSRRASAVDLSSPLS